MEAVHFILGVHNHQPIGNFDHVFEKAYSQSYLPFLEAMERHPSLHWNLHATGILWDWLEAHHPEYGQRIEAHIKEGRVEILTGGYYEPILSALPDADKVGQIRKLTDFIQKRFGVRPRGLWLAERVWEPSLAKVLHDCDVEYTLLDDAHFLTTGLTAEDMVGSYLTEDQGATLRLLPIRQDLRYAIPFKDSGVTLNVLRQHRSATAYKALVMFDDGEKFGLWPDTQAHVYERGWLESFLTVLESNQDWIYTSRASDYLDHHGPLSRVYLPTSSYSEMSEWTLPAAAQERLTDQQHHLSGHNPASPFLRGGFWRNFLTKYEEANTLHKKMQRVSGKVHAAIEKLADGRATRSRAALQSRMLDALWAGQCNCAYWHGVFGGLYLPHLRQAVYRRLLEAEGLADSVLTAKSKTDRRLESTDVDKDGQEEIIIETPEQNLYLAPHRGGSLYEWDLKPQGLNVGNVLTRRAEGYHRQLASAVASGEAVLSSAVQPTEGVRTIHDLVRVKEVNLDKHVHTDWYRRASLLDHFFHPNTDIGLFARCQYGELGDFVNTGYEVKSNGGQYPQVRLTRRGTLWTEKHAFPLSVDKTLTLYGNQGWQVTYRLKNLDEEPCPIWFGCEMAFAFGVPQQAEPVALNKVPVWRRRDESIGMQVQVEFNQPTDVWDVPLYTVALSEEGFERTYQGTVLVAHSQLTLNPGQTWVRSWQVAAGAL